MPFSERWALPDRLYRRHFGHGRIGGVTERSGTGSHLSAGKPGVCDQLQKVCPNLNKAGRIPWFSAEFRFGDPKTTPGEDKGYSIGCTNPVKAWPLDGQRTLADAREVKRSHTGNSPGTAVLQKSSTRPSPSPMQWPSGVRGGDLFTDRIKGVYCVLH